MKHIITRKFWNFRKQKKNSNSIWFDTWKFSCLYQKKKIEKQKILKSADHFICISKNTGGPYGLATRFPKKNISDLSRCDHFKKNKIKKYNSIFQNFLYVGSRANCKILDY